MKNKKENLFTISLFGIGICVAALIPGFTVFRENRLAKGVSVSLWESADPTYTILILIMLAVIVFVLIFRRFIPTYTFILGVLGNIFIVCIFYILAESTHFLTLNSADFSRISVGAGAWMLLLGGYIITSSSVKEIQYPLVRFVLSYAVIVFLIIFGITGMLNGLSLLQEFITKKDRFFLEFFNHISLAFSSVGLAMLIGIPLGLLAYRKKKIERAVFFFVNTAQTIPSLALFGLLIAPLSYLSNRFSLLRELGIRGIGTTPALIALTLYALLPITRNIYTSLKAVDQDLIEAGRGMGLNRLRLLFTIELPLAAPILLNGLRLAAVQAIGNTTVAALIGAGGFGFFIFQGLGQAASDLILLGAIPVVFLAVFIDRIMQLLINILTPKGLQMRNQNIGGQDDLA